MSDSAKITATHLCRRAVVYIRQSSPHQVERNRESTARQYRLVERAIALGWQREQVSVVDEDLGVSGSTASPSAPASPTWPAKSRSAVSASCSGSKSRAWLATTPTGTACSISAASPTR